MTQPTEPIEWAELADPSDVVEPATGIREAGYQYKDIVTHEELNATLRGIYRWLRYTRDSVAPQTHTEFFDHEEQTGAIWEGGLTKGLGDRTENHGLLPKNQPTVFKAVRCGPYFFAAEGDGVSSYLVRYDIDGEGSVANKASTTLAGFSITDIPAMAASDEWVALARFGSGDAIFYNRVTNAIKTFTRTDGRFFKDAVFIGRSTVVMAADEKIEHYNLTTLPSVADETDASLSYDFDGADATKDVQALAHIDGLVIASGDARTDTTQVGIFDSGTPVGGLTVVDGVYTISALGGASLRVDNTGLVSLLAYDIGADVTMVKTYQLSVAPDSSNPYFLSVVGSTEFSGQPTAFDMDGHHIYVSSNDLDQVIIYDKRTLQIVLKGELQLASVTDIFTVCGADSKFFVGRLTSAAHPSAAVYWTNIGPTPYVRDLWSRVGKSFATT